MKIKDADPEFKARYERWKKKLEAYGLYNPGLSSLTKPYTKLDLEAQKRSSIYNITIDFSGL